LLYIWILFNLFALGLLLLDLRVLHRRGRVVSLHAALGWSLLYVVLAALFAVILFFWQGHQAALEFVTGYVLELSLSADNLFVFLLIFNYFAVPEEQQHHVLFWGVVVALILRGIFIVAGAGLIHRFHWLFYLFGMLLIYSGIRLCLTGAHKVDPAHNPLVRRLRRLLPVTNSFEGGRFFIRNPKDNFRLYATPLFIVLLVIETTDLLFAVDSVPAVLAITLNAFIVYSANVFAILGLRTMYFAVAGLMKTFRFFHYGLAVILVLMGVKMLTVDYYPVSTPVTLSVVAGILAVSVVASVVYPKEEKSSIDQ
jgi:tellurite resistance protein TerC